MRRLLASDDSYVAALGASVPVAVIFAIGCMVGWWFRSARITATATAIMISCFGGLLWVSDYVHDFGEGDQILGFFGIGVLLGGTFGFLALVIRDGYVRLTLSIVPHLCFGIGYGVALHTMSQ